MSDVADSIRRWGVIRVTFTLCAILWREKPTDSSCELPLIVEMRKRREKTGQRFLARACNTQAFIHLFGVS